MEKFRYCLCAKASWRIIASLTTAWSISYGLHLQTASSQLCGSSFTARALGACLWQMIQAMQKMQVTEKLQCICKCSLLPCGHCWTCYLHTNITSDTSNKVQPGSCWGSARPFWGKSAVFGRFPAIFSMLAPVSPVLQMYLSHCCKNPI